MSKNAHLCIHIYPQLAYVAVDIYSFNNDLNASHVMSTLKVILGSDRIKATSIRRGDFGCSATCGLPANRRLRRSAA